MHTLHTQHLHLSPNVLLSRLQLTRVRLASRHGIWPLRQCTVLITWLTTSERLLLSSVSTCYAAVTLDKESHTHQTVICLFLPVTREKREPRIKSNRQLNSLLVQKQFFSPLFPSLSFFLILFSYQLRRNTKTTTLKWCALVNRSAIHLRCHLGTSKCPTAFDRAFCQWKEEEELIQTMDHCHLPLQRVILMLKLQLRVISPVKIQPW